MDILSWFFTGLLTGFLFNVVVPRRGALGFLGSMGAGALGGVGLAFIASIAGLLPEGAFSELGVALAFAGALGFNMVCASYRLVSGR
ncbi:hypothetical protein [Larsenimonas suaedae]|uniref:GlsB/YeaQ/YmgE family stress response membrane protein n=1 Tax=Larsenimonas suaedae TaxID=1851019 RepID=A0ABU1GWH5_9GAMM|nr:hypothetical protein [Larsenimonas suaedae]MCM2972964.1 hypothetical protein [Larsenimonas suaedae]MDR5896401.1 hypothetical protein [Larsenimonas suaedae]